MTEAIDVSRRAVLAGTVATLLSAGLAHSGTPASNHLRRTTMNIMRSGSQASAKGPAEYFTGAVRIDMPFKGTAPARIGGAVVTFEPGARTAWHTHPLGQTLIVTSGAGWVQMEGSPKEDIRAGDIVWIPQGEKHWHGATAATAMTHIAVAEALDGKSVDWMEKVSDAQFRG
jgi:quercetin dioxygenase-like cupin family protein